MIKIRFSSYCLIYFAALLLLLPLNWLCAAILAALVHELFHLAAAYLLGGSVREIIIGSRGVVMEAEPLSPGRQWFCSFAGPFGSLLLLMLVRWLPRVAICGLIQGVFNLLPLLPLDGGHMLQQLLYGILKPSTAKCIFQMLQRLIRILLLAIGIASALYFGGFALIPVFFLLPRILFGGTIRRIKHKRYGHDRITETNPAMRAEACQVYRR